jgi:uncharacterized protein CbrC (UPF0167 family)
MPKWEVVVKQTGLDDIRATVTERLWAYQGWLVRTFINCYGGTCAMTFVPDPNHQWKLEDLTNN